MYISLGQAMYVQYTILNLTTDIHVYNCIAKGVGVGEGR
jgi:hypothetical protein